MNVKTKNTTNRKDWQVISHAVSEQKKVENKRQQDIYNLFLSLVQNNKEETKRLLNNNNIFLDFPLTRNEEDSIPNAVKFFHENYPFDKITPICWASFEDNVEILKLLYEFGADLSFPGPSGRDALSMSVLSNAVSAWEYIKNTLLDDEDSGGINWALRTSDGRRTTRLMDAVNYKNLTAVTDMVGFVDLSKQDYLGKTALHYNLLQDPYTDVDMQIGRMLIDYGAPIRVEDNDAVAPIAMISTPEQKTLVDKGVLMEVTKDAYENANDQKEHLAAKKTRTLDEDSPEPDFPQIQRPVKFKRPLF